MSYIVRVDDRLIHGQVVEGWIKPLRITTIVIASDSVYCDLMQKALFELSVPPSVTLKCCSLALTAEDLARGAYDKGSTLILVASLHDLVELIEQVQSRAPGASIPPVNIGGLRHSGGKKQVYRALCLDESDLRIIRRLLDRGVVLEYYLLPNENRLDLGQRMVELENAVLHREEA